MSDGCAENCPVTGRVDALQKEFDRYRDGSTATHKQMFDRLGALEQDRATLETKLDGISGKLDHLAETVGELAEKPGKRWESLVGYLISAAAGAFLLWLAAGGPGLG